MSEGRRAAIVMGLRTPFAKQGTAYARLTALDLGTLVVSELLARAGIKKEEIRQLVYGQVIPSLIAPNVAREVVLATGLPRTVDAFSVSRACATGYQSTVSLAQSIADGSVDCGIAGGTDSASDVPMTVTKKLSDALVRSSKARSLAERIGAFRSLSLGDIVPVPPALREYSTGLTMGESAEKMAKDNAIPRAEQDAFAHRSHQRAAAAWADGRFAEQVMTARVPPKYEALHEDNLVRKDSTLEAYAKLKPVFDRVHGSVTAGNSSPLTDGASALLMMSRDKARSLGLPVLGYVKSHAFCAVDPADQLLIGPAYATPMALDRAGLELKHMDLVDMHEAFAAQVLCNTRALESREFAQSKLGRSERVGTIDWDRFNVNGGSIALGHPFAATGGRQILQTLHELKRRGGKFGLVTACAAGGLGSAIVLEAGE